MMSWPCIVPNVQLWKKRKVANIPWMDKKEEKESMFWIIAASASLSARGGEKWERKHPSQLDVYAETTSNYLGAHSHGELHWLNVVSSWQRKPTQSVKIHARTHIHFVISQREPKKVREEDIQTVRLMKTKIIEKTVWVWHCSTWPSSHALERQRHMYNATEPTAHWRASFISRAFSLWQGQTDGLNGQKAPTSKTETNQRKGKHSDGKVWKQNATFSNRTNQNSLGKTFHIGEQNNKGFKKWIKNKNIKNKDKRRKTVEKHNHLIMWVSLSLARSLATAGITRFFALRLDTRSIRKRKSIYTEQRAHTVMAAADHWKKKNSIETKRWRKYKHGENGSGEI